MKPIEARALFAPPRLFAMAALLLSTATCKGTYSDPPGAPPGGTAPEGTMPFEAVSPAAYVTKIKNLLTGLPPTQAEIDAVTHSPSALRGLIDGWLSRPEAKTKLLAFFGDTFQQTQMSNGDFSDQLRAFNGGFPGPRAGQIVQNFQESFARTVWELVMVQGHPFTEVLTTRSYMLTPALMSEILFISRGDSSSRTTDVYSTANPGMQVTLEHSAGPIPIAQTLDPTNANYLHFYVDVPINTDNCPDPVAIPTANYAASQSVNISGVLHGGLQNFSLIPGVNGAVGPACLMPGTTSSLFTDADFNDWRMVSFRQPGPTEPRAQFWDLPSLRNTTELAVPQQRVGFFTTPAFYANWATNNNNQHRVTVNQTLIVALGTSFDSSQTVVIAGLPSTTFNANHATNPACASCHVALDPMRQFFSHSYDVQYQLQVNPQQQALYGSFSLDGVQQAGESLYDLADILASHPRFAPAWVQKVCTWANSAPCADDDPQLARIAATFQNGHFNFRSMLLDLLSSAVVTGAQATVTQAMQGEVVTIARANHFCVALTGRLNVPNVCGVTSTARLISANIPSDGYTRGAVEPFLPTDPQLFFRGAVENLCREIALQVVDSGPLSRYSSRNLDWSLSDMVHSVMAIQEGNDRYAPLLQVLTDDYGAGIASGESPSDALRSTFTLACTSPTSVAIGL